MVALEVVDSIASETVRRTLKKRAEAVAEEVLVHPPAGQCRLRVLTWRMCWKFTGIPRTTVSRWFAWMKPASNWCRKCVCRCCRCPVSQPVTTTKYRRNGVCNLFMLAAPSRAGAPSWISPRSCATWWTCIFRRPRRWSWSATTSTRTIPACSTSPACSTRPSRRLRRGAAGVALHAQARQLAQHRPTRVRG